MSNITDEFIAKTGLLPETEVRGEAVVSDGLHNSDYRMFDDGSAEIEVLEFIYSLVRLIKPKNVLETGTYFGLMAGYIALGLRDNGMGHLDTIEWEASHINKAKELWNKLEVQDLITEHHTPSLDYSTNTKYQLVIFDTEPQLRFLELDKFWDNIVHGGTILVHDLHYEMGTSSTVWLHLDKIKDKIKKHELTVMSFYTPRGLTLMRKYNKLDYIYNFLKNG